MKCEFCERTFNKLPYERVLRGKKHIFCSEGCFNLYHYNWPKFDMNLMYNEIMYPFSPQVMKEAMEEAMKETDE
ncbi:MAG: hypothetical protein NTV30_04840 [Chloroflexi bacterium]|nr:hypothetical protein [Chloroflexota bacterium]